MNPQQRAKWFRLKIKTLVRNNAISCEARILWILLESYANMDGTSCHPSIETLCEVIGKGRKWVAKYLRELRSADLIRSSQRKIGRYSSCRYSIRYPITYRETTNLPKAQKGPSVRRPKKDPLPGISVTGSPPTPSTEPAPSNIIPIVTEAPPSLSTSMSATVILGTG